MVLGKNFGRLLAFVTLSAILISGCTSEKKEEVPEKEESVIEAVILEPEGPDLTGLKKSPLTGLYIPEEKADLRPVGVMINNNHACLPQSGIGGADIYYETLAEGGITRLFAVFQSLESQKVGPIRSAREYFTTFALDNDAIFVHHGGSPSGYSAIRERNIHNADGMSGGFTFFRDEERANTPGMYEHSSYIKAEGLYEALKNAKYRTSSDPESGLFTFIDEFSDEITLENGIDAPYVMIPVSFSQISEFMYDEENRIYKRYQNSAPQIDAENGETLTVKNVIIQFTDIWAIADDDAGRMSVSLIGSGKGKYITNGKAIDITWKKDAQTSKTKWFKEDGSPLSLNCGKTWIMVVNPDSEITYGGVTEPEVSEVTETVSENTAVLSEPATNP